MAPNLSFSRLSACLLWAACHFVSLDASATSTEIAACRAGDKRACMALPGYAVARAGLTRPFLELCEERNEGEFCLAAAFALREHEPTRFFGLLERACQLGFDRGCAELAFELSRDGDSFRDLSLALEVLPPSCSGAPMGYPCSALSARPLHSLAAIRAGELDCDGGDADACFALGQTFAGRRAIAISKPDRVRISPRPGSRSGSAPSH